MGRIKYIFYQPLKKTSIWKGLEQSYKTGNLKKVTESMTKKAQMQVTITAKSPTTTIAPCLSHLSKVTELLFKLGIVLDNKTKHNFTE